MVAPGAPTGLAATAHDAMPGDTSTQIDLAWTAPAAIEGVAAPTGYRIEWSPDGASDWEELVEDTGTTDVAYSDAGLPSETTRHYRVFGDQRRPARPAPAPPSNVDARHHGDRLPTSSRRPDVERQSIINGADRHRYDRSLDDHCLAINAARPRTSSAFTSDRRRHPDHGMAQWMQGVLR